MYLEIQAMLRKGAIQMVEDCQRRFLYLLFLVEKRLQEVSQTNENSNRIYETFECLVDN